MTTNTRRITALILLICMILTLTACQKEQNIDELAYPDELEISNPGQQTDTDTQPKQEQVQKPDANVSDKNKSEEDQSGVIIDTSSDTETGIVESEGIIQSAISNSAGFIPDGIIRDSFSEISENKFHETKEENISTFAADVDTASYTTLRKYINQLSPNIPASAVRVEEMINYFNYDYKEPTDEYPFSVNTEIFDCPWNSNNKLLRIGLGTAKQDYSALPSSNIVFLIDVSGSMSTPDKLPLVIEAFSTFAETLDEKDTVSIVTYAGSDTIVLDGVEGSNQRAIHTAFESLSAGGGTNGSKGIITAYEIAQKHFIKNGNNRIILATDGDLNIGITDTESLKKLITEKKESGIFLSVMGFGTGNLQDDKLEALADNGNGNYSYIDSKFEARKVLIEEAGGTLITVAKDVKIQLTFNKESVERYRLIGYENRRMAPEDFNDDSKDGGEIGAGHKVTALYELVLTDEPKNEITFLSIRYKKPDSDKSEVIKHSIDMSLYTEAPSEDSIFAASVAQFGMLIRKSENVSGTFDDVYNRIIKLDCVKEDPYKKEFAELVTKYKSL